MEAPPPPVTEIERRLRWPWLSTLLFLLMLAGLLAVAAASLWVRPSHPHGLPGDAALAEAAGLPDAGLGVLSDGLRVRAAVFGGEPRSHASDAASLARAAHAESVLTAWSGAHPTDARGHAALGALALVRHDHAEAAAHFRRACDLAPHHGEARLGWGVALALQSDLTPDPAQRRALLLKAIAQFAAVDPSDEDEWRAAQLNRARLLEEAGRNAEAQAVRRRLAADTPR
jgi:cytochrome c-type biogenesis protein CcmH/NrfG